ncbi:GNAT family N-acetyltransferase [Undibacterium sp. TJN19]|uniref:GNAT family N-acetyltransferase n=1 Tax=Undibacterium sp. TJN19 TaxID=3413055 RepID=UPI003BEF6017
MPEKLQYIIRKAAPADNPQIRNIVSASLADFGITVEFSGLDAAIASAGLAGSSNAIELVAEVNGEIAACLAVERLDTQQGKLFGFHVNPLFRGRGLGRQLLLQCMEIARQRGFLILHLHTWDTMQSAIHLYESTGWLQAENPPPESGANRAYMLKLI